MEETAEARAATSMVQYIAMLSLALEAAAQVWESRARERAEKAEREVSALHAAHRARYTRDRLEWEPLLDPDRRAGVSEQAAAKAWCSAQSWRGYPDAEDVIELAEQQARVYAPDLMRSYDHFRAAGSDPLVAMSNAVSSMRGYQPPRDDPWARQERRTFVGTTSTQRGDGAAAKSTSGAFAGSPGRSAGLAAERYEQTLSELTTAEAAAATATLTETLTPTLAPATAPGRSQS